MCFLFIYTFFALNLKIRIIYALLKINKSSILFIINLVGIMSRTHENEVIFKEYKIYHRSESIEKALAQIDALKAKDIVIKI